MDLCVGLDVIIAGIMDAMAGTMDVAADAGVVITTDAAGETPSVKASARDTGRDTMTHCGTAADAAVAGDATAVLADAVVLAAQAVVTADAAAQTVAAINPYEKGGWITQPPYSHENAHSNYSIPRKAFIPAICRFASSRPSS